MSIAKCCALLALRPLQTALTSFKMLSGSQITDQGVCNHSPGRQPAGNVTEAPLEIVNDHSHTFSVVLDQRSDTHQSRELIELKQSPAVLEHYLAVHASQRLQAALPGNAAIQQS